MAALDHGDDLPAAHVHAGRTLWLVDAATHADSPQIGLNALRRRSPTDAPRGPHRAGPCRTRRRPRAAASPTAQGLHPPNQALPGRLPLLHLRPPARDGRDFMTIDEVLAIAGRASAPVAARRCSRWATSPSFATPRPGRSSPVWATARRSTTSPPPPACSRRPPCCPTSTRGARRPRLRAAAAGGGLDGDDARVPRRGSRRRHFGSPDKLPARRLATLGLAGEARVPFTTGILIGIGRRAPSGSRPCRRSPLRGRQVQEVIVQNFRPSPVRRWPPLPARSRSSCGRSRLRA